MNKYGWKIGDRITLQSAVWPLDLDLRIVGEVPDERAPMLWFNREYLDQALRAQGRSGLGITGMIWVRLRDPKQANAVMRTIDELSRNSEAETACETEKSFFANFFGSLKGFVTIMLIVTGLVALCIVFIAANTASMAVRERAGEIAVLKAFGFGRRVIFGTLLAETLVLSLLAGGVGILLAVGLTECCAPAPAGTGARPARQLPVTAPVIGRGVVLSILVGLLAGVVPAWGAARQPVAETLREVF